MTLNIKTTEDSDETIGNHPGMHLVVRPRRGVRTICIDGGDTLRHGSSIPNGNQRLVLLSVEERTDGRAPNRPGGHVVARFPLGADAGPHAGPTKEDG